METFIEGTFRFTMYMLFGLTMETLTAIHGIDGFLGFKVNRRVPKKYLEGFVSAYMIPLHGFGILFLYEAGLPYLSGVHIVLRYLIYAVGISFMEVAWGFFLDKTLGFYPWDYYAKSKYRMFPRGYTLWTLVPAWGIAGLVLEVYVGLMRHLSPYVSEYFLM